VGSASIRVMDGDTVEISWSATERETVRVLGIDAPELFEGGRGGHVRSAAGMEARGFARGTFAAARRVELLRAAERDRYRRTLGYFFLDGRNYSVLALRHGMARETISRFGDNGFPREAAEVMDAGRRAKN
jgi:endonuclease YncB( thermonuclease family)